MIMIIGILMMIMRTMRVHDDDKNWIKNTWSSRKWPTNPREPKDKYVVIPSRELTPPPQKWHFEDDFPFPKVGYVNSLEGTYYNLSFFVWQMRDIFHSFMLNFANKYRWNIHTIRPWPSFISTWAPQLSFSATNFFWGLAMLEVAMSFLQMMPSQPGWMRSWQPRGLSEIFDLRIQRKRQATRRLWPFWAVAPGFLRYFSDMSMSWMLECSGVCAIQRR